MNTENRHPVDAQGKKIIVGGQAVMEGVMMQGPERVAIAVRRPDNSIVYKLKPAKNLSKKYPFLKWPVIRGVVNFVMMLYLGMGTLTESTEMSGQMLEEPSPFEKKLAKALRMKPDDVVMLAAVVIALVLAVGMFFVLPTLLEALVRRYFVNRLAINALGGAIRIMIFIGYVLAVSRISEIKRVFRYHGAEHKSVHCFESGGEISVKNAQAFTTLHPRCGTSFLLIVMVISILIFMLLGSNSANVFARVLSRLALLPLVAGVSYEILRALGRADQSPLMRALKWPGMMLQRLTTAEPDDGMVEVAQVALRAALGMEIPEGVINVDSAEYRRMLAGDGERGDVEAESIAEASDDAAVDECVPDCDCVAEETQASAAPETPAES